MPVASPPLYIRVIKTEEKGSDVNIASYLLLDACRGDFDQAIVVSNDSDLVEPIRMVQTEIGLPVGVFNPHKRQSAELKKVARFSRNLHQRTIANSQFSETRQIEFRVVRRRYSAVAEPIEWVLPRVWKNRSWQPQRSGR